jgi:glycosyltransferase involved in cell wall biosynthesis
MTVAEPLIIHRSGHFASDSDSDVAGDARAVSFEQVKSWIGRREFWAHLFAYPSVELRTYALGVMPRPLATAALIRLMSHGCCTIRDETGACLEIRGGTLLRMAAAAARDLAKGRRMLRRIVVEVANLSNRAPPTAVVQPGRPLYLRSDLWFGLRSGGSVGHVAGVVNNLKHCFTAPIVLSTDRLEMLDPGIDLRLLPPLPRHFNFRELPEFAYTDTMFAGARDIIAHERVAFIYQRYSRGNYTGAKLRHRHGIPLVLEFNGSETWVARHWGGGMVHERALDDIEGLNLRTADLVVVVSSVLRDGLLARGIPDDKMLVNPNGVDPRRFRPGVGGDVVRAALGLGDKIVIGFIGTFERWHGAEILAEAFGRLMRGRPDLRTRVRLLMIGDGPGRTSAIRRLDAWQVADITVCTGQVAQATAPAYIDACDILASPHVPNPDGTPFFGSPTKLFEYMAMGRGIVASDLNQIGEILEHGRTAWLVAPADPDALSEGLGRMVDDAALRERLGREARLVACETYTWNAHTRRIVDRLNELCSQR